MLWTFDRANVPTQQFPLHFAYTRLLDVRIKNSTSLMSIKPVSPSTHNVNIGTMNSTLEGSAMVTTGNHCWTKAFKLNCSNTFLNNVNQIRVSYNQQNVILLQFI